MTMEKRTEILLVGETAQSCLQLMQWLERRGADAILRRRAKTLAVSFPTSGSISS
jgi:hypothetical protein